MIGEFGGIGAFVLGKEWKPRSCHTYLHAAPCLSAQALFEHDQRSRANRAVPRSRVYAAPQTSTSCSPSPPARCRAARACAPIYLTSVDCAPIVHCQLCHSSVDQSERVNVTYASGEFLIESLSCRPGGSLALARISTISLVSASEPANICVTTYCTYGTCTVVPRRVRCAPARYGTVLCWYSLYTLPRAVFAHNTNAPHTCKTTGS